MLITRETDYAIRAMRALADGRKKTLAEICEVEIIPQQFGYKIMKRLAKAGFVMIKRGKEGGYIMVEDFKEKSLFDMVTAMEASMEISPCIDPDYICEVPSCKDKPCKMNVCLGAMQQQLNASLKSVNLYSLFN